MRSFAYSALEAALNRALQWDPDTLRRLSSLQGKAVQISVSDWQIEIYGLLQPHLIKLQPDYNGKVDTTIRGTGLGLIKAVCSGASGPALLDQGIEVSGDVALGEKIRDILKQIDVDWEEALSRFTGDAVAHEVSSRMRRAWMLGRQTLRSVGDHVKEFFQYEKQYLPRSEQVEVFYHDIARLRNDVERAAARLDRLEQRRRP